MSKKQIMKQCDRCDGAGQYNYSPQYTPFNWHRCGKCNGTGLIPDGNNKEDDTDKNRFKDIIKGNPDLF